MTVAERVPLTAIEGGGTGRERLIDGAHFILDAPEQVPAVWGDDDAVAWAAGEMLLIVGPAGTGKTTLGGQLTRCRLGLADELLGMEVVPDERKVLYLALDRSRQIARALRRAFEPSERERLRDRLLVWRGPLPFDLATDTDSLRDLAVENQVGTVVIDSLKDAAIGLADDETGARVNRAIQTTLAAGIEVAALHHQRKASAGNTKPNKLADVYGSTWITAGAGSVLLLWGEPGDPIVELTTLKPAAGEIGPLTLEHDFERGVTTVHERPDLLALVLGSPGGVTTTEAAISLYGSRSKADREKARRRLEALSKKGLIERGEAGEIGDEVRYRGRQS